MRSAKSMLLALLVSGALTVPAAAQCAGGSHQHDMHTGQSNQASGQQSAHPDKSGKAMSDQKFLMQAAEVDLAEVQMAQLAQQKSNDSNVKKMAEHVLNDHQQNREQLQQIAQQQGVTLPTQPDAKHQAKYQRLSKLSGAEFDKAFVREQVKGHKKSVAMYQKMQTSAKDDSVKSLAAQTLPKLQQHLQMAQQTAQQMGVNTSGGESQSARNTQRQ